MSPLRASDLPADVRRRYGLDDAGQGRRKKKSRAGVGDGQRCPGRCGCGERFSNARAWEKHATATGHRRWSIDIEENTL